MRQITFVLCLLFLSGCSNLIFQPSRFQYLDPAKLQKNLEIKIEDVYFKSLDGTKLHGWYLPNQVGKTRGTILFLHGNAENISTHIKAVWWLPRTGYNLFMPDYRGYGFSEGEPDLEGVHADVQSAMEYLFARQDVDQKNLLIYGHSMGGAVAITSLADSIYRDRFRGLIVEGTFTSYRTVAREAMARLWFTWLFQYPLSWTIRDDYRPIDAIPRISPIPLLIVHGSKDPIIGHHHGKRLYEAAKQPKEFWLMDNGRHNVFHNARQRDRLLAWLDKVLK